jgi:PAS domain S-box-containing protein
MNPSQEPHTELTTPVDATTFGVIPVANTAVPVREASFACALELSHTFIRDMGGTILYWTKGAEQLYGWNRTEANGRRSHDLLATEFPQPLENIEAELLKAGYWVGELKHRRKDGLEIHVSTHWALQARAGSGTPIVVETSNDISQQKQTEKALAETKAQLEAVFESMAEPMILVDRHGVVIARNAAFRNVFGPPECMPKTLEEATIRYELRFPNGDVVADDMWPVRRVLRGETVSSLELDLRRSDGKSWIVNYSGTPIRDQAGNIIRAVLTCQDITDRRRTEYEFLRIRHNLETAQYLANVGSWDDDFRTASLWWSKETYKIFGVPEGTPLTTKTFFHFVHPEDRDRVQRLSHDALNGKSDYDAEHRIIRPNGDVRHVHQRARVLVDSEGVPIRMIGSIQDITERKLAEQELRRREAEQRAILEATPTAICVADRDGKLIAVNRAFRVLHDLPQDHKHAITSASRREMFELTWPDGTPLNCDEWPGARVLRGDPVENIEINVHLRHTGRKWVGLFNAAPIRYEHRNDIGFVVTINDITGLKRATAEVERMHRMVNMALTAGKSGAWEWNLETGELLWTEQYYRMFGLQPGVTPSMDAFYEVVHADDRDRLREIMAGAIRDRAAEFRAEFRVVLPDGIHWIERVGQIVTNAQGQPARIIGLSVDVTERKRLERALKESNRDLQQFAYTASHDLQEPLRIIRSYSDLLASRNRGKLDEDSEQFLNFLVAASDRMSGLIGDLLQFSCVANGKLDRRNSVPCNDVLRSALDNLELAIRETNARVSWEPLPAVKADDGLLARVFQNLISNSIKYRHPDRAPEIHVAAERRDAHWIFSVRDNGIGLDMKYARTIFNIFKRLHAQDDYSGTGIGLAIVKRAIERHGGTVYVESEVGIGSAFYFTVPAHDHGETHDQHT